MDMVIDRRLQWLGHVGRMGDDRLPKRVLFGELRKKRACHGPKKRWRDLVLSDLKELKMKDEWYQLCQDRKEWRKRCQEGIDSVASSRKRRSCAANRQQPTSLFLCACGRHFRRQGDLTRHRRFCES